MSLSPLDRLPAITARELLAHGISLARDPGGASGLTVRTRERIADGHLPGPTLQVAGEILDTSTFENLVAPVASVDDVNAEVARQAAAGVDWIKLYTSLGPALVEAAIDAAHGHGLRVTGHLEQTTWTRAAALGIDSLVHVMPGSPALLPEETHSRYAKSRASTLSMLEWFALVDHDSAVIREMVAALRRHQVSLDPTLVVLHSMAHGDRETYTDNPALAALPHELVGNWRTFFNFNAGWQAADYERARDLYPRAAAFARMLFEAGVTLTAGSDANNPWLVPGDSYHTELELLVGAGIPALDVITIATRNGAQALGLLARTGTVEAGKRADLVLLTENPLTDIRATRKIAWVMKGGRIHTPEALQTR